MNSSPQSTHLNIVSLATLYSTEFPNPEWLVEDLIPKHACVAFSGQPESYKSFAAQAIAVAVSQGEKVFSRFATKPTRVLIIDLENHGQIIQERMKSLGAPLTKDLLFCFDQDFSLENNICVEEVIHLIQQFNIGLVIFDSLIRMHHSKEDNSVEMAGVTKKLKRFVDAGASVVFIHHDRKGDVSTQDAQSMRGSSEIRAAVDLQYGFKAKDNIITVQQLKNRLRPKSAPFTLTVVNHENTLQFAYQGQVQPEAIKTNDVIITALRELLSQQQHLNRVAITEQLRSQGFPKTRIEDVFSSLLSSDEIVAIPTGAKNEKVYSLGNLPNLPKPLVIGSLGRLDTSGATADEMTDEEIQHAFQFEGETC